MKVIDEMVFYRNLVSTFFYVEELNRTSCEIELQQPYIGFQSEENFARFLESFNFYIKSHSIDISAFALRVLNKKREEERSNKKDKKKGGKK